MSFGLCNAPTTFQLCILSIFSDMVKDLIEVFIDYSSMVDDSFDRCFNNLAKVLKKCVDSNLALNWEECHFIV